MLNCSLEPQFVPQTLKAQMLTLRDRFPLFLKGGALIAAVLLCAPVARAQHPIGSGPHAAASKSLRVSTQLIRRDLIGTPGKEVIMRRIEVPPGASSPPHRHYAQVFVYVLQGRMVMQVKGGPRLTLGPGQSFYEGPSDVHMISVNASKSEPAKLLSFFIKDKGKPATVLVAPHQGR